MTTIGYATLQIIPSLDGVEAAIDKQLGGKLRVTGKAQGKQLAKGVGEGLKDLEREVDSAAKAYGRLRDKASDSLGKVRADEAALKKLRDTGASDDRIIRAEERLAKSRRDSSRAIKDAETGHRSLTAAQSALANSSGALGNNLGGLAGIAGRLGPALATAGAVAGGAALAGVAALGAGVLVVTNRLYDLGAQFDDTFDSLRIKTGATGPELRALEEATKRISTSTPLAISDIGDVVGETSRALHLTGTDLDNVAKNIANLGRLTGENVDIRTLGQAFRGFGVDAKDQVPALDSMLQATQATGIGVNELLGIMAKSGAGLRGFNLSFGESAALATEFEKLGLDPAKGLQGFTKGLASLAKDGKTGREALQGTVDEIEGLIKAGNDPAARDLTNKLFGAKGGSQFFEAIRGGALDLRALANAFTGTGDTIQQAADDTDDFEQKWQEFKNNIAVSAQPLATGFFDAINNQLTSLADTVQAHQPEIIGFFTAIGLGAVSMAEFTIKSTGLMAQGFGELIAPIGDMLGAILKSGAALQRLSGDTETADEWDRQAESLFGLGEGLYDFGEKAKNFSAADIYNDIKQFGEQAQEAAKFTTALGDATAALPDGKTITISDNSPETVARLKALGIEVQQTPNGITVTATTDEAKRILDAFRSQQTGQKIPVGVTMDPAQAQSEFNRVFGPLLHPTVTPQIAAPAGSDALAPGFFAPPIPPPTNLPKIPPLQPRPGRAFGGAIFGAGTATSDSIPAWLSNGEHVLTADDVTRMGGQAGVYAFRNMLHRAGGGEILKTGVMLWPPEPVQPKDKTRPGGVPNLNPGVGGSIGLPDWSQPGMKFGPPPADWWYKPVNPDDVLFPEFRPPGHEWWGEHPYEKRIRMFSTGGAVGPDVEAAGALVGTAYSQAGRTDCSGMVARVINSALGIPGGGLMSTKNAAQWLAERGFRPGIGGPGSISVGWYDHGPNPNDGHMAMTLSDGTPAEAGGSAGDMFLIGGGASGANNPQFDQHMYLPIVAQGEGPAGNSPLAAMAQAGMASVKPKDGGTATSTGSGGGGGGVGLPDSLSGFGSAIGEVFGGQIRSALDVFGIPDSPNWLKAGSQLLGGIKVGDGNGNTIFDGSNPLGSLMGGSPQGPAGSSVVPRSATPLSAGTTDNAAHGLQAGQPPGPREVNNWNIRTATVEDAFLRAQRIVKEKAAAKLTRF